MVDATSPFLTLEYAYRESLISVTPNNKGCINGTCESGYWILWSGTKDGGNTFVKNVRKDSATPNYYDST
jgi:hypothetical protein